MASIDLNNDAGGSLGRWTLGEHGAGFRTVRYARSSPVTINGLAPGSGLRPEDDLRLLQQSHSQESRA